jgi:hypothetical protein
MMLFSLKRVRREFDFWVEMGDPAQSGSDAKACA